MTLFDALGFRWNRSAVPTSITAHSIERVCFRFHKMLPEFVWDASVLEGDLMDALPAGTQTSMTVFKPEVDGQKAGAVKAFLMAENADDLRCAQWVITHGSAKRGEEQWPL